jgi:predicted DNA-binding transcriptional regulator AlpA
MVAKAREFRQFPREGPVTKPEVENFLQCVGKTLWEAERGIGGLAKTAFPRPFRVGRYVRYLAEDIHAWIAKQQAGECHQKGVLSND